MTASRRSAPSIAVPIAALAIAGVLLATVALFLVTFGGPPPHPRPVRLEALARSLGTGVWRSVGDRPVHVALSDAPPVPRGDERRAPASERLLAELLNVPQQMLRVYSSVRIGSPAELRGSFTIGRRTEAGWQVARTPPPPLLTHWHWATLQTMLLVAAVLGALAWGVAGAISRPIGRLAHAAQRARAGSAMPIPRGGPREVRALAEAVATMQSRLSGQVAGRTAMLAAIAHDMGTPLSRIAFWLERLPDDARERAMADVAEMRAMLASVLRFARDERADAPPARIDLASLLETLADDRAATGEPVTVRSGDRLVVRGDTGALRRAFSNLLDNALRYGGTATLHWHDDGEMAHVFVDDAGPGFPSDARRLFEPFERGDPSRNRQTGGTGLGLSIVRSIVEAHGGSVELRTRAEGGGRVAVRLPIDPATPGNAAEMR